MFEVFIYNIIDMEQEYSQGLLYDLLKDTTDNLSSCPSDPMPVEHYYTHFLSLVKDLLDCNVEPAVYEDKLREMFGVNSYVAFTLDKLISNIVRQVCIRLSHICFKINIKSDYFLFIKPFV